MNQFFSFGISLTPGENGVGGLPDIPAEFELLELSGDALDEPEALREYLDSQDFHTLSFRHLMYATLSRQITGEPGAIVSEFKRRLRKLLRDAAEFHAKTVSLDVDLELVLSEPARERVLDDILRSVAGDLAATGITLHLAMRLPGALGSDTRSFRAGLNRLCNSATLLALDANPHELLNKKPDFKALLMPLRFEIGLVRLCYETELGNVLLPSHVTEMLTALHGFGRRLPVFIAPSRIEDLQSIAGLPLSFSEAVL